MAITDYYDEDKDRLVRVAAITHAHYANSPTPIEVAVVEDYDNGDYGTPSEVIATQFLKPTK